MSSDLLLRATGLSKVYAGRKRPLSTLWHALFGTATDSGDQFLVLSDIDIEIRSGETVGIMGRNGAGKTTLLGILGNVIQPTSGTVERHGRIATLLGLTAGFNPNFSGRENAYLFCSIQGIDRAGTDLRIGAIEAFADLGRYFEMPLQSYSSGMQSRLAFACAAHVDANLIIIDETLAVGDANFRMKCYDRIRQMKEDGQTFLLVSHNQNLVANFCTRGIVLEGGLKVFDGATFDAVECYKRVRTEQLGDSDVAVRSVSTRAAPLRNEVSLSGFRLLNQADAQEARITVTATLQAHQDVENVAINFGISSQHGIVVCSFNGVGGAGHVGRIVAGSTQEIRMKFFNRLLPGRYFLSAVVHELRGDVAKPLSLYQNVLSFDVPGTDAMAGIANLGMTLEFGK